MSFDNSRYTFNPFKSYSSVVLPQGRVQLDADWNEFLAEIARRIQAGTLDTMGRAVYPVTTPNAFYISGSSTPYVVNIGQGRIYIDGLLAENHGPAPGSWDPALAELSGAPQPAPASITGTPNIAFTGQTMFPGATAPKAAGTYLFYIDAWTREVTWLEDPAIVDPAVGIDTSGRLQTVWQVRWMPAGSANLVSPGTAVTCGTPDASIAWPASSAGLLTNGVVPNTTTGNCCLTPGTGYTGLENQFYRVQIHRGGPVGTATFKWSRENASVATGVTNISTKANPGGTQVTVLSVFSLGRDQVLSFGNGDWIELLDDNIELNGQPDLAYPSTSPFIYGNPGILCQIGSVDPTTNSIYLTTLLSSPPVASAALHTRIRRWDQSGIVNSTDINGKLTAQPGLSLSTGDILVPTAGTALVIENGLTVSFSTNSAGSFLSGDFWCFSARTDGSFDQLTSAPPLGTHHHYSKLSVVTFDGTGTATSTPDCRTPWPPPACEGDCGCCTATVGDNQNTFGKYISIQQAIDNLPPNGGTVCILPGQYYESIVIDGLTQVTLQGSGPQTTLYAFSANPKGVSDQGGSTVTSNSGLNAIITITSSQHVKLTGFTIEAPDGMSCILIDQISADSQASVEQAKGADQVMKKSAAPKKASPPAAPAPLASYLANYRDVIPKANIPNYNKWLGNGSSYVTPQFVPSSSDVTIAKLVLAASTAPAIAAVQASLLDIVENRILMKDVASLWPAIYVSGSEITIEQNWIGLQDNSDAASFATAQLLADLAANFAASTSAAVGNSGIQIGGYSTGVYIVDNNIERGAFNAITLGAILRLSGSAPIAGLNGLFLASPATTAGTTLVLPAADANGNPLAADGPLQNVRIEHNRIGSFGLCAIGPVGFFTYTTTPEIVSVANLAILDNTISGSLQSALQLLQAPNLGYGAICLPDLQYVLVQDNTITDFGSQPGAQVCGIFILNGEQVEISRNQILETRDWATVGTAPTDIRGLQAGIGIPMVSPPALNQSATASAWTGSSSQGVATPGTPPLYQPGLPALRIDQNVVRLPLGCALDVLGYGPFSITGNKFTSGGTVPAPSISPLPLTVSIANLGVAIELDTPTSFTSLWGTASNPTPPTMQVVDNALANSTSGMVLFANNQCQLETRASGATGLASVAIVTLDYLTFSNNVTWMDGIGTIPLPNSNVTLSALMDVFLLGGSINVSNNRFQEGPNSVLFSGLTAAVANVTTGNISTFCLFSGPNKAPWGANANNISLEAALTTNPDYGNLCDVLSSTLLGGFGLPPGYKAAAIPSRGEVKVPFAYRDTAITSDPVEKLNSGVNSFDTLSASRIQQLSVTHQARLAQYTRIAAIVTLQSGASSPQAVAANAAVTTSQTTVTRIAMYKRQITASAPAVTATGWALYGTVYNSSNTPVSAYSLYFVDSTNTFQNTFGTAYTAADGSFQIVYAGPPAGQAAPTSALFVQVCNAAGDPVYTSPTAFTPSVGAATYQVITLPAGEKPIGRLPIVFREISLPSLNKEIVRDVNIPGSTPENPPKKG